MSIFDDFIKSDKVAVMTGEISSEEYHANHQFVSKHLLDLFSECPLKYSYAISDEGGQSEKDNPALRFGSAVHCLMLEPDRFAQGFAVLPPSIKVRRGKEWEAFSSANEGKEILTGEEFEKILAMKKSLQAHEEANALLFQANGVAEQTVLFRNSRADGKLCKARLDRVLPEAGMIVDLKTCTSAHPKAFANAVEKYRYDVQGAFYLDAMEHLDLAEGKTEEDGWLFAIVAIEKDPPYAVAVYFLNEWLDLGTKTYVADMLNLIECEKTGKWASYNDEGYDLPLSPWAEKNRGF